MNITNNPSSLPLHPPDESPFTHTSVLGDSATLSPDLLAAVGLIHPENTQEKITTASQTDAEVSADGSFAGITKKNIDDEFEAMIGELVCYVFVIVYMKYLLRHRGMYTRL